MRPLAHTPKVTARDVADGVGHGYDRKTEGECHSQGGDTIAGGAESDAGEYRAAATHEYQHECADHLC